MQILRDLANLQVSFGGTLGRGGLGPRGAASRQGQGQGGPPAGRGRGTECVLSRWVIGSGSGKDDVQILHDLANLQVLGEWLHGAGRNRGKRGLPSGHSQCLSRWVMDDGMSNVRRSCARSRSWPIHRCGDVLGAGSRTQGGRADTGPTAGLCGASHLVTLISVVSL